MPCNGSVFPMASASSFQSQLAPRRPPVSVVTAEREQGAGDRVVRGPMAPEWNGRFDDFRSMLDNCEPSARDHDEVLLLSYSVSILCHSAM